MEKPILDQQCLLEKFHGKGGWTFTRVPKIEKPPKSKFNWVRVKGSIDGFMIKSYHLAPMGNGELFLPLRAEIRKKIKKEVGDYVHVTLFYDNDPIEIPEEMMLCLQDEPAALRFFNSLSDSERKFYVQWVYSAKRMETKVDRLTKTLDRLSRGLKMYDKEI